VSERVRFCPSGHIYRGVRCSLCNPRRGRRNPVATLPEDATLIYPIVFRIEAQKGNEDLEGGKSQFAGENFYHDFEEGTEAYGLSDGTVLLRNKNGKPLWGVYEY
jgi:hypothetical protein